MTEKQLFPLTYRSIYFTDSQVYFVPGQYSSDNAIGVSILAAREAGLWLK